MSDSPQNTPQYPENNTGRRNFIKVGTVTALALLFKGDNQVDPADQLFPFERSQIKFRIDDLMNIILQHEGLKREAYPDRAHPDKGIIGAGFNLSVTEEAHYPKNDPYQHNGHRRKDPTSETLWEVAGFKSERLKAILHKLHSKAGNPDERLQPKDIRNVLERLLHTREATDDISNAEAKRLLYVSTRHAVHNAMAYFADFNHMSASQQLGVSELVYQLGTNLPDFKHFMRIINDPAYVNATASQREQKNAEHWRAVQRELVDSKWYRTYHTRAMEMTQRLDPYYDASHAQARVRLLQIEAEVSAGRPQEEAMPLSGSYLDKLSQSHAGPMPDSLSR